MANQPRMRGEVMKIIDRLAGNGQIYQGENLIGEYTYGITVFQESGPLKSMTGIISMDPIKIAKLMSSNEDKLQLCLEDGRHVDFFFASTDGQIQPTGGFY